MLLRGSAGRCGLRVQGGLIREGRARLLSMHRVYWAQPSQPHSDSPSPPPCPADLPCVLCPADTLHLLCLLPPLRCCHCLLLQPVVVLATCHTPAEATPANLVQFFAGPTAAPVGAGPSMHPQQQQPQQAQALQGRLGELLPGAAAPAAAAAVAAPGIVRMAQPPTAAWRRAAAATAEQVAAAVATQAALLLHRRMLQPEEKGEESGAAPLGPGSPVPAASKGPQQAGRSVQQAQEGPVSPSLTPSRRRALGPRRGMQAQQAQQGLPQPEQCNTVELEQGLRMFDRLLSFQQQMATALAREPAAALHRWAARPSSAGGGSRRRPGGPGCCLLAWL